MSTNHGRDEKDLNTFKDRLRTDEEEITRLGFSARAALLNLRRDATPEGVIAATEEIKTERAPWRRVDIKNGK